MATREDLLWEGDLVYDGDENSARKYERYIIVLNCVNLKNIFSSEGTNMFCGLANSFVEMISRKSFT